MKEEVGWNADSLATEVANGGAPAQSLTEEIEEKLFRDPFWPVGYAPPSSEARTAIVPEEAPRGPVDFSGLTPEEQALIKSQMSVGGILKQGSVYIAIINDQLVKDGDDLNLRAGNLNYEFKVKELTIERVLLEAIDRFGISI